MSSRISRALSGDRWNYVRRRRHLASLRLCDYRNAIARVQRPINAPCVAVIDMTFILGNPICHQHGGYWELWSLKDWAECCAAIFDYGSEVFLELILIASDGNTDAV